MSAAAADGVAADLTTAATKPRRWLRIGELAERWDVSRDTVARLIAAGDLRAAKIGGQWRVHAEDAARYECRPAAPAKRARRRHRADPAVRDFVGEAERDEREAAGG